METYTPALFSLETELVWPLFCLNAEQIPPSGDWALSPVHGTDIPGWKERPAGLEGDGRARQLTAAAPGASRSQLAQLPITYAALPLHTCFPRDVDLKKRIS